VEYQLDSLHPFEEGSVYWDFAVWDGAGAPSGKPVADKYGEAPVGDMNVLVGIAQKEYVDSLAGWFAEAGIPVSQFALTTPLLLRLFSSALQVPAGARPSFFVVNAQEEGFELIGNSVGGVLVSREVPEAGAAGTIEVELAKARSEMRLGDEERPLVIFCGGVRPESLGLAEGAYQALSAEELLPAREAGARGALLPDDAVGVAAARAAVDRGNASLNLLPAERRSYQSPMAYVPTYALSAVVVLLAVALGLRGLVQDWLYSRYLDREMQTLMPQVQEVEARQEGNRAEYERLLALAAQRRLASVPLAVLEELTRLMPPEAWLQQLQYDGASMTLTGNAPSASAVLQALSESRYLESPQFLSALSRTQEGNEGFRIGVRIRNPLP
jgi:Tfp pilus assembly protein PilN